MRGKRKTSCAKDAARAVHKHERNMHRGKRLTRLGRKGSRP